MSYSMTDPTPDFSPYALQAAENRPRFLDI